MQLPYGVWPAVPYLSASRPTTSPSSAGRWYIDPVSGSDVVGVGGSRGSINAPLRTFDGLRRRLESLWTQAPQLVSLRNGLYPWTTLRPTLGGGQVIIYADEAWDPTVFNIIATGTAGVGTTASSIVGAFSTDQHRGKSLRFTTGAAAGQRKTIQSNSTTALVPAVSFSPAPASGDTYQIFDSNVSLTPQTDVWQRIASAGIANRGLIHAYPDSEGYVFAGVKLVVGPSLRFLFDMGRYELFGVEVAGAVGSALPWRMEWSAVSAGCERTDGPTGAAFIARAPFSWLGAPSVSAWAGWGISGNALPHGISTGHFTGYVVVGAGGPAVLTDITYQYSDRMRVDIAGGSLRNTTGILMGCSSTVALLKVLNTGDVVVPEFIGGASSLLTAHHGTILADAGSFNNTGAGPVFLIAGAGQMYLSSLCTGQAASGDSLQAVRGGRVYLNGSAAPNFGRAAAATDYNNGNGTPVNKTFFAAVGTHMPAFTDGSTVIRVGLV
jgi:hypothetical protein